MKLAGINVQISYADSYNIKDGFINVICLKDHTKQKKEYNSHKVLIINNNELFVRNHSNDKYLSHIDTMKSILPEKTKGILEVRLPLYKLVNVLTTYKRAEFDLRSFTDIICIDLIHQYIADILDVMLEETANLKSAQVSDEEINKFMRQVQDARTAINVKREVAYKQMNQMLIMIESAKMYEKKLESTFEVLHKNHQEISGER